MLHLLKNMILVHAFAVLILDRDHLTWCGHLCQHLSWGTAQDVTPEKESSQRGDELSHPAARLGEEIDSIPAAHKWVNSTAKHSHIESSPGGLGAMVNLPGCPLGKVSLISLCRQLITISQNNTDRDTCKPALVYVKHALYNAERCG